RIALACLRRPLDHSAADRPGDRRTRRAVARLDSPAAVAGVYESLDAPGCDRRDRRLSAPSVHQSALRPYAAVGGAVGKRGTTWRSGDLAGLDWRHCRGTTHAAA